MLMERLSTILVLSIPQGAEDFLVDTDASEMDVGCVLMH